MGRIGALQLGSDPAGTEATLAKLLSYGDQIRDARLDVLVTPEALLGGYPKGSDFGVRVGYRTPAGRETYLRYWRQAIEIPGPECERLCELARACGAALVVGVIERVGATLYCATVLIDAHGTLNGVHRKLLPTAAERIAWGQGDHEGFIVMGTRAGRVTSAICWENYMPLYRYAMYEKQIDVWCAPTVDDRDIWQVSMRHIAYEGRCFLISACQYLPNSERMLEQEITLRDRPPEAPLIRGGSLIISPFGDVLAGPLYDGEGLITTEIDPDEIIRARFDLDVVGHYARRDLFSLQVGREGPLVASDKASPLGRRRNDLCHDENDEPHVEAALPRTPLR